MATARTLKRTGLILTLISFVLWLCGLVLGIFGLSFITEILDLIINGAVAIKNKAFLKYIKHPLVLLLLIPAYILGMIPYVGLIPWTVGAWFIVSRMVARSEAKKEKAHEAQRQLMLAQEEENRKQQAQAAYMRYRQGQEEEGGEDRLEDEEPAYKRAA